MDKQQNLQREIEKSLMSPLNVKKLGELAQAAPRASMLADERGGDKSGSQLFPSARVMDQRTRRQLIYDQKRERGAEILVCHDHVDFGQAVSDAADIRAGRTSRDNETIARSRRHLIQANCSGPGGLVELVHEVEPAAMPAKATAQSRRSVPGLVGSVTLSNRLTIQKPGSWSNQNKSVVSKYKKNQNI